MNKTNLISGVVVALSIFLGLTPFIIEETSIENHKQSFESNLTVLSPDSNNTSLGINSDRNLDFGYIPQGSNVTKFLNMSVGKKSILTINSEGSISEFLEYDDRMYFQGSRSIPLEAKGRSAGNYTGKVTLNFEIPKNQAGKYWLDLKYIFYNVI